VKESYCSYLRAASPFALIVVNYLAVDFEEAFAAAAEGKEEGDDEMKDPADATYFVVAQAVVADLSALE
jgi:hypothetical protein